MKFIVDRAYSDSTTDTSIFPNVLLKETTTGYIDSIEPDLFINLMIPDTESSSFAAWIANPGETISAPTPERVTDGDNIGIIENITAPKPSFLLYLYIFEEILNTVALFHRPFEDSVLLWRHRIRVLSVK